MISLGTYINSKNRTGFTLIEAVVYIALISLVLVSVVQLMYWIMDSRSKTEVIAAVEQQATFAMDEISQRIRNATGINAPTAGNTASSLSLVMADVNKNPTVIDLASGMVRIKEGAGAEIDLTSSKVVVSNLSFYNVTRTATPGSLKVSFTVSYASSATSPIFNYQKNYFFSANPRGY